VVTPLERLVGPLPRDAVDYRDWSDMVSTAIAEAWARDRERFIGVLLDEPSLFESSTIVFAFGIVDDPRVVPPLAAALRGKDATLRWSAAHALASRREAVDALLGAVRDRSSSVRGVVFEALGNLRDRRALPALKEALTRPSNAKDAYLRKLLEAAIKKLDRGR